MQYKTREKTEKTIFRRNLSRINKSEGNGGKGKQEKLEKKNITWHRDSAIDRSTTKDEKLRKIILKEKSQKKYPFLDTGENDSLVSDYIIPRVLLFQRFSESVHTIAFVR